MVKIVNMVKFLKNAIKRLVKTDTKRIGDVTYIGPVNSLPPPAPKPEPVETIRPEVQIIIDDVTYNADKWMFLDYKDIIIVSGYSRMNGSRIIGDKELIVLFGFGNYRASEYTIYCQILNPNFELNRTE